MHNQLFARHVTRIEYQHAPRQLAEQHTINMKGQRTRSGTLVFEVSRLTGPHIDGFTPAVEVALQGFRHSPIRLNYSLASDRLSVTRYDRPEPVSALPTAPSQEERTAAEYFDYLANKLESRFQSIGLQRQLGLNMLPVSLAEVTGLGQILSKARPLRR
jgi:hypothetical protein